MSLRGVSILEKRKSENRGDFSNFGEVFLFLLSPFSFSLILFCFMVSAKALLNTVKVLDLQLHADIRQTNSSY